MKKNTIFFLIPVGALLLLLIFSGVNSFLQSRSEADGSSSASKLSDQNQDLSDSKQNQRQADTAIDRLKSILSAAINKGEYDPELLKLIQENEKAVFEHFATIRYPKVESTEDPLDRSDELLEIIKALDKHFEGVPFSEVIDRISLFEESEDIHNATVQQILIDASADPDNTEDIYKWFIENPDRDAVKFSGGNLGRSLTEHGIDSAWDKVSQLPEGFAKRDAYDTVMAYSLNEGFDKAASLLERTEKGPILDMATETFIQHALNKDQLDTSLFHWASEISSPQMRFYSVSEIVRGFLNADNRDGLMSWRDSVSDLDQEVLDEVDLAIKQAASNVNADDLLLQQQN